MAEEPKPLKDPARSQQRVEFLAEAFRGLLLIHGGGAIALLAFFQALKPEQKSLAKLVLIGILFLVFGLLSAIMFMILRYHASLEDQRGNPNWKRYQKAYYFSMYLSVVCFAVAMFVVVIGGLILI